jgi:pimeloyl-ACP methyl ester carboxylesterase
MEMDAHSMDITAQSLENNNYILSLSLLGHGDSEIPENEIPLPDHSEIMREAMRKKGFIPTTLIGHSVGGMMGMILAANHPEEFDALILVDIAPFKPKGNVRPSPPESFQDRGEARKYIEERYPIFTNEYIENRLKYGFEEKSEGKLILKPRGESIRPTLRIDMWPYVKRLQIPALLLIGENSDLVTPDTVAKMKEVIPYLKTVVVEGASHMIPQERPSGFEEEIGKFLNEIIQPKIREDSKDIEVKS